MRFDNGWGALTRPGAATDFFGIAERAPFDLAPGGYSAANAWWLAEICRLSYKLDGVSRNDVLGRVGLEEVRFISNEGTQCALIRTGASAEAAFAVFVFRGSTSLGDWVINFDARMVRGRSGGFVHRGCVRALARVWTEVELALDSWDGPIFYTGHSQGAALATLTASVRPPTAMYTYGSPCAGDGAFVETLKDVAVYRVVNHCDAVPNLSPPMGRPYVHAGELHYIAHDNEMHVDPEKSFVARDRRRRDPSLKETTDLRNWYDPLHSQTDHTPLNYVAHLANQIFGYGSVP